jgi:hypothetical protein
MGGRSDAGDGRPGGLLLAFLVVLAEWGIAWPPPKGWKNELTACRQSAQHSGGAPQHPAGRRPWTSSTSSDTRVPLRDSGAGHRVGLTAVGVVGSGHL